MNKNSKKVTILLPFFLDGGVERAMINLSKEMISSGLEVNFVFITNGNGPLRSEIPKGCQVFELNKSGPITAIPSFIKYIKKNSTNIIISDLTPANLLAIFSKLILFKKIKVIIGVQVAVRTHMSTSFLRSVLRPIVYKILFPIADKIVAVSKGIEKDLKSFGIPASKIKVIYNPIFSSSIELKANEQVNHPWFEDKKFPIILAVGRLHKQKDFPILLKAFAQVLLKKKAKLIILGEGEERSSLSMLINDLKLEEDVDLVGFVNNPYSYMKNASVFVLSSSWEGFGNVLAEAMSFGTPLVSTDCPWGPGEILENGKYGELVPVGDIKAMSEAILNIIDNKNYTKPDLLKGAERFKTDIILKQYLDLIQYNK